MSEPTDFDDDADTWITDAGAVPLLEPGEDDVTTPSRMLCAECLRTAMPAGPIPPTSPEGAAFASPETCLRGTSWGWCAARGRLSLWLAR